MDAFDHKESHHGGRTVIWPAGQNLGGSLGGGERRVECGGMGKRLGNGENLARARGRKTNTTAALGKGKWGGWTGMGVGKCLGGIGAGVFKQARAGPETIGEAVLRDGGAWHLNPALGGKNVSQEKAKNEKDGKGKVPESCDRRNPGFGGKKKSLKTKITRGVNRIPGQEKKKGQGVPGWRRTRGGAPCGYLMGNGWAEKGVFLSRYVDGGAQKGGDPGT